MKTTKTTSVKTLKDVFAIILAGNKDDSRKAAREVRNLLYSSQGGQDKYRDIKNLINNALSEYAQISEEWADQGFPRNAKGEIEWINETK